MDFIVDESIKELVIEGKIFKYKPSTAGDEIDWFKDYTVAVEKKIVDDLGNEKTIEVLTSDGGKLSLCKLRNIVEVPFNREELKTICGINKEFKYFTNTEKDMLFQKFKSEIYNKLILAIDEIKLSKKE